MKPITVEDIQRIKDLLGPMPEKPKPIKVTPEQWDYLKQLPTVERMDLFSGLWGTPVELCEEGEEPTFPNKP